MNPRGNQTTLHAVSLSLRLLDGVHVTSHRAIDLSSTAPPAAFYLSETFLGIFWVTAFRRPQCSSEAVGSFQDVSGRC